jgi:hypothetical protein
MTYIVVKNQKYSEWEIIKMFKSFINAQEYTLNEINKFYDSYIVSRNSIVTPFGVSLVEYQCKDAVYCIVLYSP